MPAAPEINKVSDSLFICRPNIDLRCLRDRSPPFAEENREHRHIRGSYPTNPRRLPQCFRADLRELLPRFSAQARNGVIVNAGGNAFRLGSTQFFHSVLLPDYIARVFEIDFDSFPN